MSLIAPQISGFCEWHVGSSNLTGYKWGMSTIITLPGDRLQGLDIQAADTWRILSARENEFVIELYRASQCAKSGGIAKWLVSAKGSVHLDTGETVDDVRDEHIAQKYLTE